MIAAGIKNIPLTKYLIEQVRQSPKDRMNALKEYVPSAKSKDWVIERAGQRVQVIKKDEKEGGILEFGTEVINTADGSLAVLLGASPGASTAVSIMVDLLGRCFRDKLETPEWQEKLKVMIPSYGQTLNDNPALLEEIRKNTSAVLKLDI
jgi:malate dehydrogenase (quinone)